MAKAYWEPYSEDVLDDQVRRAKALSRSALRSEFELAIDYIDGRQRDDTEQELMTRFPSSMEGDQGQRIYPLTIPLAERYVAETATAYNRPVSYTITWADGSEDDTTKKFTKIYREETDAAAYQETMHRMDQIISVIKSAVLWHGWRRNKLFARCIYPHDLWCTLPKESAAVDPTNPDDYESFTAELFYAKSDVNFVQKNTFVNISQDKTIYYKSVNLNQPGEIEQTYANPFLWPQIREQDLLAKNATLIDIPILPLSFWHSSKPADMLIPDADPDIVYANRELNVAWSVLFDTFRFQGHDTPVKKLANPDDPKAFQKHGARFPVVLNVGEDFGYASASAPYSQLVELLREYVRTIAVGKRLSINDFSTQQQSAISGFAKMVDNLPKLEARQERIQRLKYVEENKAYPINAAILRWAGKFPSEITKTKLNVKYADIEFPRTEDERAKKYETEFRYGISSPAHVVAEKYGVGLEEAVERIKDNKERGKELADEQTVAPETAKQESKPKPEDTQEKPGALLGRLIGMRRSVRSAEKE